MARDNDLQLAWGEDLVQQVRAGRMSRRELLRKGTAFGLSLGAISGFLAACGDDDDDTADVTDTTTGDDSETTEAAAPATGGVLKIGANTPPTEVDPVTMYDGSSIAVVQLVLEYLVWLEPDYSLTPMLAESWEPEEDGSVWAFTLREGVTFSDGTPLDAETVKASFDRLLDPESQSAALSAFGSVLSEGGVSVRDERTVVFTLDRPFSDFAYLVSAGNYNALILKSDYASDFQTNPIGTGPFLMTSYDADTGAVFEKNPDYWDEGKPYLDGAEVVYFADAQAAIIALQSGDIDTQVGTQLSSAAPIEADDNFTIDIVPGTGMTAFTMRVDTAPFDVKEVRQAVAWGLDRVGLVETVTNGAGVIGNDHLMAPAYPASPTDLTQREADPAQVEELLAAAGVEDLSFTLTFDPPNQTYALAIQNQLQQVGITVELEELQSDAFYGGDQGADTPWLFSTANLVGWAGRPVPSQFVIPMVMSDGVWNGSKYANPDLDAAAAAYDASTEDADKEAQAKIIADLLWEDVPVILSFWSAGARAFNNKVQGLTAHPSAFIDINEVSITS